MDENRKSETGDSKSYGQRFDEERIWEANFSARSNRAAKRLIPIPTRTIGDSMILYIQSQLKLGAT